MGGVLKQDQHPVAVAERRITIEEVKVNGRVPQGELALQQDVLKLLSRLQMARVDRSTYRFVQYVLLVAQQRRIDAGYQGAMSDGGASRLESEVETYIAGLTNTTPAAWDQLLREFNREHDPEYAKYLELHKKFGNL